ncbi:hypothetical protein BRC2024_PQPTKSFJ_CDS_0145 [Tegunavirus sp. BRC001]
MVDTGSACISKSTRIINSRSFTYCAALLFKLSVPIIGHRSEIRTPAPRFRVCWSNR